MSTRDRLPSWISLEESPSPTRVSSFDRTSPAEAERKSSNGRTLKSSTITCKRRQEQRLVVPVETRDSLLLHLCRTKQWELALNRAWLCPEEIRPQLAFGRNSIDEQWSLQGLKRTNLRPIRLFSGEPTLKRTIYQETPLGAVCASDLSSSYHSVDVLLLPLIRALLTTSPEQVRCSQAENGNTALRDAIKNETCPCEVIRLLLRVDLNLSQHDIAEDDPAVLQKDRDGLLPIDHIIRAVHLGSRPDVFDLLAIFLQETHALAPSFGHVVDSVLIRLFSLGTSFALVPAITASTSDKTMQRDSCKSSKDPRLQRIFLCAQMLLEDDPSTLICFSKITGCSPLHTVLRNYGNVPQLVSEIIKLDVNGVLVRHRNHYGDLPLHTACSVGVPMDVLRAILRHTARFSNNGDLIWTTNGSPEEFGYTPVDLEWIRHIEGGNGFFTPRSFCPVHVRGVHSPGGRHDRLCDNLLTEAVDKALSETSTETDKSMSEDVNTAASLHTATFGSLLTRLLVLIRTATGDFNFINSSGLTQSILHRASLLAGPLVPVLPTPILRLLLAYFPREISQRDELGRLPLHCSLASNGRNAGVVVGMSEEWKSWIAELVNRFPGGCGVQDFSGRFPIHHALASISSYGHVEHDEMQHEEIVTLITSHSPGSIEAYDPVSRMFPFMMAAINTSCSLNLVFCLLRQSPSLIFRK